MHFFLFTILFMGVSFAQQGDSPVAGAPGMSSEQPMKESTTDLRNNALVFSIEEVKSGKTLSLFKTPAAQTFLKLDLKGEGTLQKIDAREAQKLDMNFASRFLKVQYEIESLPGDCSVTLRLNMKGETQELCQKDEKKTQEIHSFFSDLLKRF